MTLAGLDTDTPAPAPGPDHADLRTRFAIAPTDRERDSRLVRAEDVILANATRVQVFVPVHVLGTTQWRTTSLANLSRRDRQAMLRQWRDHGLLGAVALEAGASS